MILRPGSASRDDERQRRVRVLTLESVVGPVTPPAGITYRTAPAIGIVAGGKRYVLKHNTVTTIVAELLGYGLAELVHVPVPGHGVARLLHAPRWTFCSAEQERLDLKCFLDRGRVVNSSAFFDTLVFDLWVGNDDRNWGGFVGAIPDTAAPGQVEMLAIDFECSHLLCGMSEIELNAGKNLLPRIEIRQYLTRGIEPFRPMVERLSAVSHQQIERVFDRLRFPDDGLIPELYPSAWAERAIQQLASRAARMERIVRETYVTH